MTDRKTLIIGLDGGTWTILKPAVEQGYMPFVKSLIEGGVSGILESTIPAITPAAWSSFQTGMNPGDNGVFDFFNWDRKSKTSSVVSSTNIQETIWDIASKAGKRVAVINVPMTYPPRAVNGSMITGLLTPSLDSQFTYPPELKDELLETVPDYSILNIGNLPKEPIDEALEGYIQTMIETIDGRAKAACWMIEKDELDLMMVHFQASDIIQHLMWHYLDPTHPLYEAEKHTYILEHFFRRLDGHIKTIVTAFEKKAGDHSATFIISDHGFQSNNVCFSFNAWLKKEGYLAFNSPTSHLPLIKKITKALRIGKLLRPFMSSEKMATIEKKVVHIEKHQPYNWEQTRVIVRAGYSEGFLFVHEDDPEKYEQLMDELIEKIKQIKDPKNGVTIASAVYRKEEIFKGKQLDIMPDLLVVPTHGYSFIGKYDLKEDPFHDIAIDRDVQIGRHHPDGILIAASDRQNDSKDIKAGTTLNAHITDIAPTILHYMGIQCGKSFDGKVLDELFSDTFTPEFHESSPVESETVTPEVSSQDVYSSEDQEEIQKRLSDLGYM